MVSKRWTAAWVWMVCLLRMVSTAGAGHLAPLPPAAEGKPVLFLEAEEKPADGAGEAALYPAGVQHDGAETRLSPDTLSFRFEGHRPHTATLDYALNDDRHAGFYAVFVAYSIGGVAAQEFTIEAGPDAARLSVRARLKPPAGKSWELAWRGGEQTLAIYPGDRLVRVTMSGAASGQKNLDAVLLARRAELPAGITAAGGELRRRLTSRFPAPVAVLPVGNRPPEIEPADALASRRIYVLESERASESEPALAWLDERAGELAAKVQLRLFYGEEAKLEAQDLGIATLPAIVVMDGNSVVRGVKQGTAGDVAAFFSAALASGPVTTAGLPRLPKQQPESPQPLRDGMPQGWLIPWREIDVNGKLAAAGDVVQPAEHDRDVMVVDRQRPAAGVAGLSLWGIDYEPAFAAAPGDWHNSPAFDSHFFQLWERRQTPPDGTIVLLPAAAGDYGWARGISYAQLYLYAGHDIADAQLHLRHNGVDMRVWLDGQPVAMADDPAAPLPLGQAEQWRPPAVTRSRTDQNALIEVEVRPAQPQQTAAIKLSRGWHRLNIKWVMQHVKEQPWVFAARLTDASGNPLDDVRTQTQVPEVAPELHAQAARLVPQVRINAPFNLARVGEAIELTIDPAGYRHQPLKPVLPFDGTLVVRITDYDGKTVLHKELAQAFPQRVTLPLGSSLEMGHYAVHTAVLDDKGRLVAVYPPDGFNVIGPTAAMFERRLQRKQAVTYYFMGERYDDLFFPYMERIGIFRNVGGSPLVAQYQEAADTLYKTAHERGMLLAGDFWDMHSSVSRETKMAAARAVAPYTRWFKSMNEIDIIPERPGPEKWVERTQWEYEAAHAARSDAVYVGGSLVRVGSEDQRQPDGELWFDKCLKLGLDKWQDAWDVHAYPQSPPRLEGSISNSIRETEVAVMEAYKRVGMTNRLPFWLGETGARGHGMDDRRWQAATLAKMTAWVNSRSDFQVIGFLVPWVSRREIGVIGDIPVAHFPGEAALYTAGALIDGLGYERITIDGDIQAGRFGPTIMAWTTGQPQPWTAQVTGDGPWVLVDVVGRVRPLEVRNGQATIQLTDSPVYVLSQQEYRRLTGAR